MPRYIDADALKYKIEQHSYPLSDRINSIENGMFLCGIYQAIDESTTADVAPVVHGEWLFIANGIEAPECSVCGWAVFSRDFKNRSDLPPYHKYCGHCGAKMEGSDT